MTQEKYTTGKRSFQHLTKEKRAQIESLMRQGLPKTQIAKAVGIARSTLYLELARGTVEQMDSELRIHTVYFGDVGQRVYEENRKNSPPLSLLQKFEEEHPCRVVKLISPQAYVAPSAQIMQGCIVELMAVIQSMSLIAKGCIISAGAVVNHASMCCDGVHVDCNATVAGATLVPAGTKIKSGEVFNRKDIEANDLFFDSEEWAKRLNEINTSIEKRTPVPIDGKLYNFDDVM